MIWTTEKTSDPFIFIMRPEISSKEFVKFKIDDAFGGKEIDVTSQDMSKDRIIFIREAIYPTFEDDPFIILGTAYEYDENYNCISSKLIGAEPIEWDCDNPRTRLEIDF